MSDLDSDPTVRSLREEISEVDRTILDAVNSRIDLVARLKEHKDATGLPFVDPDRERALIESLEGRNGGPLSAEGVRELYRSILALTKREVTRES